MREKNGVPDSCGLLAEAAMRGIFAAAAMCTDATASLEHVVLTTASAAGHTAAMHTEVGGKCTTHCQVYKHKPKQATSRKYVRRCRALPPHRLRHPGCAARRALHSCQSPAPCSTSSCIALTADISPHCTQSSSSGSSNRSATPQPAASAHAALSHVSHDSKLETRQLDVNIRFKGSVSFGCAPVLRSM